MSMDRLFDTLDKLGSINTGNIKADVQYLEAIRLWALRHLGVNYTEGDRVVITRDQFTHPEDGRSHYAEAARKGATGVVQSIDFNQFHDYWYAMITLDVEWSASDVWGNGEITRHWHGPVADTPEGMEPPSAYDQERHPDGRKHLFSVHVQHLRKAGPDESV